MKIWQIESGDLVCRVRADTMQSAFVRAVRRYPKAVLGELYRAKPVGAHYAWRYQSSRAALGQAP